jgi:hypothetical protein
MKTDPYERALMATIELHKLVDDDESADAEKLRDEMDVLLRHLTPQQKKMLQQLSADLWDLREGVFSDDPSDHQECLRLAGDGKYLEALEWMYSPGFRRCDLTSNVFRGLIWTRHGQPLVAAVFFGVAAEAAFEKEGA